jgi:dTDP-glucose 4,6-dehydratase
VTAIDNYLTSSPGNLRAALKRPFFWFVEADVSRPWDESALEGIKLHGLHGVFHFACPASPIDFDRIPFEILEVDSLGTMHSVDLALKHDARYLLASTSEIYGDPLVHPQRENYWGNVNTLGPRACYDETKRFAEAYVSTAMRGQGRYRKQAHFKPLNAAIVRIFNTYGPRMRPDDGRVVPELCMQALAGEPMTLHGDGTQTRSFCFVSDLVEGVVRLFESELREAVNIGNPTERTILEFAEVLRTLTGARSLLQYLPAREDDPKQRCPDIQKAREKLGWQPKVTLEHGLSKTLEYFKSVHESRLRS